MNALSINIANQLRGRKVVARESSEEIGVLTDVVIDPLAGKMLGIMLGVKSEAPVYLPASECSFGEQAIMVDTVAGSISALPSSPSTRGVGACSEMLGTHVVTREGRLLGCVSEIYLLPLHHFIVYRISESRWHRLIGDGFFISGDLPYAYSREGSRLIVPAQTERLYSFQSILDRVQAPEYSHPTPSWPSRHPRTDRSDRFVSTARLKNPA